MGETLLANYYRQLLNRTLPPAELEAELSAAKKQAHELISTEAALFLLVKKHRLLEQAFAPLSLAPKIPDLVNLKVRIEKVFPLQLFPKSNKRSRRLLVRDEAGQGTIVLWDAQAEQSGRFLTGSLVSLHGVRFLPEQEEFVLVPAGKIALLEEPALTPLPKLSPGMHHVKGKVIEVFPDYFYLRGEREKAMKSFALFEAGTSCRVIVWQAEKAERIQAGDTVILENALYKNGELQTTNASRIILLPETKGHA